METIITEIAKKFIKNLVKEFWENPNDFTSREYRLFEEAKAVTAQVLSAYASMIDKKIYEDRVGRKEAGYTVQRSNDERRIMTLFGEVSFSRTYYKRAAEGTNI